MRKIKLIKFFTLCQLSMIVSCFVTTLQTRISYNCFGGTSCTSCRKVVLFSTRSDFNKRKGVKKASSDPSRQRRRTSNHEKYFVTSKLKSKEYQNTKEQRLLEPSIVFTNNHLLLVNKPPGYHSQPNESPSIGNNAKCMLTKLKSMALGGGSSKDFLLPMHRLDQPCTGILLLAKNSKAGTRVGKMFNKHLVVKEYFCVVTGDIIKMKCLSEEQKNSYKVSAVLKNTKHTKTANPRKGGTSVVFSPISKDNQASDGRVCHLEWELITTVSNLKDTHLIRVRTDTGAKHQIRAMLAQIVKSPICGDLRYGAKESLLDKSVALHARSLFLPTLKLGDTDYKNTKFIAPIPKSWEHYFSLTENLIKSRSRHDQQH